uniref:Gelsolin-like domain-containing protein n=1 Tax=Plectus sambesii TaxID=2011161 RepID=A0A914X774_9BILA
MSSGIVDPAFKSAGRAPGIEIWRIEKLKVVPVPAEQYGYFYSGDCYIVMSSIGTPPRAWKIHFWIGDKSSADEQCAVAYKAVELDDSLDGIPIQYREIQNHESKQFLSYFKGGIRYMVGGVDTALRRFDSNTFKKRLFHVKGKRNCRVQQVDLSVQSLNQGDVFILDAGTTIFVWNGPQSNVGERIKGAEIARQIRDEERAGRAKIELIDESWASHNDFFKELGSSPGSK